MKLKIKNYKTIRDSEIDIVEGEINYLIGSNESGKTNILNAIRIMGINDNKVSINKENDRTVIESIPTKEEISFEIRKGDISNIIDETREQIWLSKSLSYYNEYKELISKSSNNLINLKNDLANEISNMESGKKGISKIKEMKKIIEILIQENLITTKQIKDMSAYQFNEKYKKTIEEIKNYYNSIKIKRPSTYFIQPMENAMKKENHIYPWVDLKKSNSLLRKMINVFSDEKTIKYLDELYAAEGQESETQLRCKEKIKDVLNNKIKEYFNKNLSLLKGYPQFFSNGSNLILDIAKNNTNYEIDNGDENTRSLGYKSFLRILLEIKSLSKDKEEIIYIIDEPEQGLHPYLQELLMNEINKITKKDHNNLTFIISSHSPYIVNLENDIELYDKNLHFISRVSKTENSKLSGETTIKMINDSDFADSVFKEWSNNKNNQITEEMYLLKMIFNSKGLNSINRSIKNKRKALESEYSKKDINEEEYKKEIIKLLRFKNKIEY